MHVLEREIALDLCVILVNSDHFLTEPELREAALHGAYCDTEEYESGFAYAVGEHWIRPAHARPSLTLTSRGLGVIGR